MRVLGFLAAMATASLIAAPLRAEDRAYCPARPGLGTPPCTIAPGRLSVETAIADWTLDQDAGQRTDKIVFADTQLRLGLTSSIEAQLAWTPYGRSRMRDKSTGLVTRQGGVGDVTLGVKANLLHPDGSGFSIAVNPFVSVPAGGATLGAGDWSTGVLLPMSYDLGHALSLQVTPELDAAVNGSRAGRHLAYSGVVGLGLAVSDAVSGTFEVQGMRDDDPAGATTKAFASLSMAWMPRADLQLDVGAVAGLNSSSSQAELYLGISRRF
ncbi:MAG: hypothetical protein B7Y45_04985 [Sphingomonas sp. 28-66-16]|nr:MAG: hypothetical protein B7Y45_04985 [Sphingomonas sp. 28-66-16]